MEVSGQVGMDGGDARGYLWAEGLSDDIETKEEEEEEELRNTTWGCSECHISNFNGKKEKNIR